MLEIPPFMLAIWKLRWWQSTWLVQEDSSVDYGTRGTTEGQGKPTTGSHSF